MEKFAHHYLIPLMHSTGRSPKSNTYIDSQKYTMNFQTILLDIYVCYGLSYTFLDWGIIPLLFIGNTVHCNHCYYIMVNKKSAIKNTGDHNWDMERMQVEKDKGNILTDRDYVNKETKDVNTAMGLQKNNNNKNNKSS